MDLYVARQPVFDRNMDVYGYELLYRSGIKNYYDGTDDSKATAELINNAFLVMQSKEITSKVKSFINFPKQMLLEKIPLVLPANTTVVEVLERVEIDQNVVDACREMKDKGYTIALDDFVFDESYLPLLEVADIIKIEFNSVSLNEQQLLMNKYRDTVKFLAEKVETRQEYQLALEMGYDYFQGYFFSKPMIMTDREIGVLKPNLIELVNILNEEEPEYDEIASVIEKDLDLSYKLLRLSGSVFHGFETKVVKHALVQIGLAELCRWLYVLMLKDIQTVENRELIKTCFVRARLMEMIAKVTGDGKRKSEYFTVGLFSSLDVLLNKDMEVITKDLTMPDRAKEALNGEKNKIRTVLDIVLYYELSVWDKIDKGILNLGIRPGKLREMYFDALMWVRGLEY
ncbi:MAG TPA: EAL domain-containing protein [Anaerovoracaceae bacterium]|nr:EAL domain-containing protein [Anaerovoracaceae bacterium]